LFSGREEYVFSVLQYVQGAAQKRAIARTGFSPEPLGWGTAAICARVEVTLKYSDDFTLRVYFLRHLDSIC